MDTKKSVHSLVLDTGPIIKNEPTVSTLLARAEQLFTVPAIISEIKDNQTRSRVQNTLVPFLTVRSPSAKGLKAIADFARRTGDLAVLSRPDIEILALTYDLECERNKGDWRLRNAPGQKALNGSPPANEDVPNEAAEANNAGVVDPTAALAEKVEGTSLITTEENPIGTGPSRHQESRSTGQAIDGDDSTTTDDAVAQENVTCNNDPGSELAGEVVRSSTLHNPDEEGATPDGTIELVEEEEGEGEEEEDDDDADSDSGGWITATNLKRHQAKDSSLHTDDARDQAVLEAAVLTTDFAMQNVALQMNLNLLSSSLQRVKTLKTFVLRCHACFQVCKDTNKQFCPRCGGPTLARVSCSTDAHGVFRIHLKKNYQYNTRGVRYSIPKPAHGSANRRVTGGGKDGWGHDLILAEDQKEYQRARTVEKKQKEKSLMDEDYLPSILTGDRVKPGGHVKVGKNPNTRRKRN